MKLHPHGERGGDRVEVPAEDIHRTGTGIAGTAGRIREISQSVGEISIDSKSFGALNEGFAVSAQQQVRTAQQHVAATAREVDAAAEATHSTANSYQATEETNAKRFTDIQNGTDGQEPPTDSRTTTSPQAGPAGVPPRPSWRDTINDPTNFTPAEQAQIRDALHKMAQPPEPGKVAGAGALTPEQRQLMARVHKLLTIERDTPMQKALPQGTANDYLGNVIRTTAADGWKFDPKVMGGFAARQQDGVNLRSNLDMIHGNRLDYPDTRFNLTDPNEPVYVMRFPAIDPKRYTTPFGAPYSDEPGMLGKLDPAVQATASDMTSVAESAGVRTDTYHREVNP